MRQISILHRRRDITASSINRIDHTMTLRPLLDRLLADGKKTTLHLLMGHLQDDSSRMIMLLLQGRLLLISRATLRRH